MKFAKTAAPKAKRLAEAQAAITNVTNGATNAPKKISATVRSLKWRSENPERYKATQRDLMRKKRAAEKQSS
jgi:hypothetical protein